MGVLLGIYLMLHGGGDTAVVASLGISLAAGAGLNILVGIYGDRFGRRNAMTIFGLLMTVAGTVLALAPSFPVALIALFLGATSPTGTEVSPFLSVEQSIVAEVAARGRRTRAFAAYNLLGPPRAAAAPPAALFPPLGAPGPRRGGHQPRAPRHGRNRRVGRAGAALARVPLSRRADIRPVRDGQLRGRVRDPELRLVLVLHGLQNPRRGARADLLRGGGPPAAPPPPRRPPPGGGAR